jgi:hypothetical protein
MTALLYRKNTNWLQVLRSADAARIGQRERCEQKNAGYCVAACGPDMRLTAIFFGPHTPDAQTAQWSVFPHSFKQFERLSKLATSSEEAIILEAFTEDAQQHCMIDAVVAGTEIPFNTPLRRPAMLDDVS